MVFVQISLYFTVIANICFYVDGKTVELFGAGASFPSVVYSNWINLYRQDRLRHADVYMKYDSIGSGGGKARIKGEKLPIIHYAGSDSRLTKQEKIDYPNLDCFPTLAGAIVMAYNIPSVDHLNLNLEVAVGMYNGTVTKWNDPQIEALNPGTILPSRDIVVIARSDKSGTTGSFTAGLSSYSPEWRKTYGEFTVGINLITRLPIKWRPDVIKLFAHTNQGMSGLIMSIDYSVGYISFANAHSSEMKYASLKNNAGNFVNATLETVQNAIVSANGSYDVMNTPGIFAYPLVSFTFLIVNVSFAYDCNSAVELVRYINWFQSSDEAYEEAIRSNMVPVAPVTVANIHERVLKSMTCDRRNVFEMMLEQIEEENRQEQDTAWLLPTFLSLCLLIAASTGLFVHLGRKQIMLHRELLKDTWKIDSSLISFDSTSDKKSQGRNSCNSREPLHGGMIFNDYGRTDQRLVMGVFLENPVSIIQMHIQHFDYTLAEKKIIIRMRDNIKHAHIMPFLGVTKLNNKWFNVHLDKVRGSLSDILQSKRIEINTDGVIALAKSLTQGLMYLHKKGIVHGHLSGRCCLIDIAWELKISDWIESRLDLPRPSDRNKVSDISYNNDYDKKMQLWTAPEIVKFKRVPTQTSDVYSLCMVFQEMFTRHEPYKELCIPDDEVISAVLTCGIRPHITSDTPMVFKVIMEKSWVVDPTERPRLDIILNSIKSAYPDNNSFLDCIIRSIELYARRLEENVEEKESELKSLHEKMEACLYRSVPSSIAELLKSKSKIETSVENNLCVLVCNIANTASMIRHITPQGMVNFLNNFYTCLDNQLSQNDIYRLSRYAGQSVFIVGLQKVRGYQGEKRVVTEAFKIALKLNEFTDNYTKEMLIGINTEIRLQIGLASGSVILGILGTTVPQYSALGEVVEEAMALSMSANPSEIRLSNRMRSLLQEMGVQFALVENQ